MPKPLAVLNVDDSESDGQLIVRALKKAGYKLTFERVETAEQMLAALKKRAWDIVISDQSLPQFDSYSALALLRTEGLDIPFIAVSGTVGEAAAVAMMKAGAHDFLMKDNLTRLVPAVERELEYAEIRRERKQTQEALLESESRFRQVWEITSDAMVLSDSEGIILTINPAYSNLCGYSPEEIIGHSFTLMFPDVNQSLAIEQYKNLFKSEVIPPAFESVIKRADGNQRTTESKVGFITKAGKRVAMLSTIRDITEQKQADDVIRASERRFRALIENSLDDISLLAADGSLIWESPSVIRNLRYEPNETLGRNMFELMHPDDLDQMRNLYKQLIQEPASRQSGSFRLRRNDGAWRWFEAIATNMLNEPSVQAIVINYRDVTESKQALDALYESEERFKNAFKHSAIGMALTSLEGKWLRVNSGLCSIVGYSEEELLSQTFQDITHPEDLDSDLNSLKQVLDGKISSYRMEKRYFHKDGKTVWVHLAVALAKDSVTGVPLYFISQIEDITERKQIEKALSTNEARYRSLFEDSPIALWEEDFSAVKQRLEVLQEQGITNFDEYFTLHPDLIVEYATLVEVLDINQASIKLFGANIKEDLLNNVADISKKEAAEQFKKELVNIAEGRIVFGWEGMIWTLDGKPKNIELSWRTVPDHENSLSRVIVSMIDITERKRIESALIQSEEAYRTLFENVPVGLYRTSADGRMLDANPTMVKIFGYQDQESFLGVKVENLYADPATNKEFNEAIDKSNVIISMEAEFRKKDGSTFWAEDNVQTISDEKGNPLFYEGSLTDITQRKLSEQAQRESEERFHSLFNRMMDGVYLSKPEGKFVDVNPAMVEMFGYSSREEMLAVDIKNELYFEAKERGSHILDTGQEEMDIYRMRRKDGSEIWVEDHGSYVHDEHGKIIYHEGILRDITERKRTDQAIAESESRFRQAIAAADAIPYSLNYAEDKYTFMGEGIKKLTGYAPEELTPTLFDEIIVESIMHGRFEGMSLDEAVELVRKGENGIFWQCDHRIRIHNGGESWISDSSIQVLDDNGTPTGSIGIIQDITEHKQIEAAAREGEARYRNLFEDSPVSLWEEDFSGVKLRLDSLRNEGVKDFRVYFKTHPQVIRECAALVKILDVNKATLKLFGAKAKDDLSDILSHYTENDPIELFENELISIAQGKTQFEWEGVNQTLDGRQIIVKLSLSVMPGSEDNLSKVIISMIDITARMQAEKAIRESEKSLRESQSIAGLGNYVLDLVTGSWKGSEIFDTLLGIDQTFELTMETWPLLVHPADREAAIEHLTKEVIGKRIRFDKEYRIIRKNDHVECWMHILGELEIDTQDQPVRIVGTIQDISKRKQAEETLRASEVRWRTLVQNLPSFIVEATPDGTILTLNHTQPGFSINDFEGKSLFEVSAPESLDQFKDAFAKVLDNAVLIEYEAPGYGPYREPAWYHRQLVPIIQDNKIHSILMVASDITERKHAEEAVRESEQRYRALFEDMPVSIWEEDFSDLKKYIDSLKEQGVTDLQAYFESNPDALIGCYAMIKVLDINQAALKMYSAKSKMALLASLDDDLNKDQHLLDDMIAIAEGKTSYTWEGSDETLTGEPIEISLNWSVAPGHEHDFSKVIVTTIDITERKRAEADSKYQLSELEALYENGLAISRLLEPKRIAQRMVQVIDQKLAWHHAAIRLYDASSDRIELLALNSPGFDETQIAEQIERINQAINTPDKGLSGWVIRHGEIVRIGKLKDDPRYIETYAGIKSGLYVPIKSGDEVIGSIAVESEQENAFTERDAHTLATLANQAAISFVNARLYLWLQKELDERHIIEEQVRKLNIELEQRVAERTAQIEAAKRRLELATHAGQIGVWEYNPRENKVIWDERMHMIHQIPLGEFDGTSQTWAQLIHPDDIEQSQINRQLAVTKNLLMNNEHRIIWPDGSVRNIMTSAATADAPDGTPERIIGINMDITERKQIEQSLRESETYARLLFNAVPDPVSVTEDNGLIVDVNQVFEKQYNLVRADIRGKRIDDLEIYPETELEKREKYLSEILRGEPAKPVELEFYVPGDRVHTLELHSYLLKVNGRQLVLNTTHDITSHKKAEEAQRIAKSEIERALRIKNEFLANMSHELRTPLNSILGISESLEEQIAGVLNDKQLKYIGIVRESGRHLLELINDILDLSKIEAGRMELDIQRISVDALCQSSLRMIKELSQKKSLNVSFKVKGNVEVILADQRRLKQSIVNLLSNAVKFTPQGKEIGLEVSGNMKTNQVEFIVWDQGVGIAQEDIKLLFKPFVQLDAGLAREYQGTGLGLALVAQMVNLHGGQVRVESKVEKGSRFIITLPWLSSEHTQKATVTDELSFPAQKPPEKRNGRILLVEDTDVVVQLISEYLRYKGYEVLLAHDGAHGIQLAMQEHPDLILMDVMMPIMDGLEATQRIRTDKTLQNTPIIALTALAMSGDSEKCLAAGMNDYLSKPIQMQSLADMIEKYLGPTRDEINEQ